MGIHGVTGAVRVVKVWVLGAALLPQIVLAADFGRANELFERRGEGKAIISQAKDAYGAALAGADRSEVLFAVDRLGRLAYYEGLITPESDSSDRKVFFKRCWDDLENLVAPEKIGENAEYYYWKGVCMAQWAKANGIASSLSKSGELVRTIEKGMALDDSFEGGGFHRLGAAVYQSLPTVNPFGPTYDLNKSLDWSNVAIASAAYPGAEIPETATGDYYYNVYEYRAIALDRKGDRPGAIRTLELAIKRIEQGDVAEDRVPETEAHLTVLRQVLATLR